MPPQLLIGMLIGAAGAALLYLLLIRPRAPRTGDSADAAGRGAVTRRVTVREVRGPAQATAVPNLAQDVQDRSAGLPFVVEKRTTRKIVININGQVHEYDSLDEVPAEFRALIEKARRSASSRITIEVNGERYTYNSREEVPAAFRHLLPPLSADSEASGTGEK